MNGKIYLSVAEGLNVPLPDGGTWPASGAWVEPDQYVRRRLKDGDLVPADPPAEAEPESAPPAAAGDEAGDQVGDQMGDAPAKAAEDPTTTDKPTRRRRS
ncbi:DUF2635 domain-containing protein [Xanthobacter sp. KR7-225]|uniref:DUF2635 domain-containing protein n=1 Tax=Xanthobacter sp. KR7-225 TaxID=3156613 RepID=UPI0032B3FCDC